LEFCNTADPFGKSVFDNGEILRRWMVLKSAMRSPSDIVGVLPVLPIFAGLIGLLLLLGAFAATWLREGR
jgi:hypothetical protein